MFAHSLRQRYNVFAMTNAKLTETTIRAGATEKSYQRGLDLYRNGAISNTAIQGQHLSGECEGSYSPFYKVRIELDGGGIRSASCNCEYDFGGYCKHIVALLLVYINSPKRFVLRKEPKELLADLTREQLLALVEKLLKERPDLYDLVEAAIITPILSSKGKSSKHKKVDTDVYKRRVRSIMHSLDSMRASEAYWHVGGLTDELRGVERTAEEFLNANDAETALEILLALIEESHDGFDYIDDSNGELGDFFSEVGETLAEVILSLDLDEDRRESILIDLDDLHDKLNDYGVDGLEVAIAAAKYGWNQTLQEELEESNDEEEDNEDDDWDDYDEEDADDDEEFEHDYFNQFSSHRVSDSITRSLARAKLNVLERQGKKEEYLALCLREGEHLRYTLKLCELNRVLEAVKHGLKNLTAADEVLVFAKQLREKGHVDDAIKVAEKGLKLEGRKASLGEWLAPIEEAQGRTSQALEAWMAVISDRPSFATYQTVKRLADKKWDKIKPDVMAALEKSYDRLPLAEVLLFEEEWDKAIKVAEGENYYNRRVIEIVAEALINHRPEWVIRTSVKTAESLIVETKSNLYPIAAEWLRRARDSYVHLGQTEKWQKYLQELKEKYKRRPALQAQLKNL